jgi:3,4-dihydroxy 2-butanone 4-phosphate synthase/GTP cyclohydrolase II
MSDFIKDVENALNVLKAGGMVVLFDDEARENEGDLIIAAEFITPDAINFMATYGRGLICLSMTPEMIDRLELPMMTSRNGSMYQTAFTISIEAKDGVSTGISAADRAHTIQTAVKANVKPSEIVSPGHIFPLRARPKGVLERKGQTEGSVDLMKIAGLIPAAVICEIMNPDGSMSHGEELNIFSKKHHIPVISIQNLIDYRVQTETLLYEEISTRLPLEEKGDFKITLFNNDFDDLEHFVLYKPTKDSSTVPFVRIHSECLTGDLFGSLKCDCGPQLDASLNMIAEEGGLLIYLRQEGRGIGLKNKLKAYALQEQGEDTVDANLLLGLPIDNRDYSIAFQILKYYKLNKIRLITNNPMKLQLMEKFGIQIQERVPLEIKPNPENKHYIHTKIEKMGHLISRGSKCK